jgi:cobaltochelatase CobS
LISWGQNIIIFCSIKKAFQFSFLNKVIDDEKIVVKEFYQKVFGDDID